MPVVFVIYVYAYTAQSIINKKLHTETTVAS